MCLLHSILLDEVSQRNPISDNQELDSSKLPSKPSGICLPKDRQFRFFSVIARHSFDLVFWATVQDQKLLASF